MYFGYPLKYGRLINNGFQLDRRVLRNLLIDRSITTFLTMKILNNIVQLFFSSSVLVFLVHRSKEHLIMLLFIAVVEPAMQS